MKKLLICGILLVLAVVAVSGCTSSGDNSTSSQSTGQSEINVTNVSVSSSGYGEYDLKAVITPKKDMDYLEMDAIWYDSSGAVIETSNLLWNVDNAKAGQIYKAKGMESLYQEGTPTKVDVYIFDSVFSGGDTSNAIYHQTVNLNK
jgi:hypothetical protein